MKYVLLIGDGMGDWPIKELGGKTPLEAAPTPNLDFMAANGALGLARTVPEGMAPGSDVAIMSLMGYYPKGTLSGRGPLEAASRGLTTGPDELVFRMNLVSVEHDGPRVIMLNHASGNISAEESLELLEALRKDLPLKGGQRIFSGVSFRHILTWPGLATDAQPSWPPHDYLNKDVGGLVNSPEAAAIMELVKASWAILEDHPVNRKRRTAGLPPANSIWLWGQGLMPNVKNYQERWGLTGVAISAVDLIKGLGKATGLERIDVPGATGWIDTNYEGKVQAALAALEELDFVVIHLEAPDEAGHQGDLEAKMKAISDFDARVVGPMLKALPRFEQFRVLAACDHFTPLELKTHTDAPIPFVIYGQPSLERQAGGLSYTEKNAASTGLLVDPGADLSRLLFGSEK